jgi:hypothetical protein
MAIKTISVKISERILCKGGNDDQKMSANLMTCRMYYKTVLMLSELAIKVSRLHAISQDEGLNIY